MNISKAKFLFLVSVAMLLSFLLGYGIGSVVLAIFGPVSPAPCEIVSDRQLRPGMVIECPTGERINCDTTFYYRLP